MANEGLGDGISLLKHVFNPRRGHVQDFRIDWLWKRISLPRFFLVGVPKGVLKSIRNVFFFFCSYFLLL